MFLSNSQQIRQADEVQIHAHGFPGIVLMESAGRLTTKGILAHYPDHRKALILCGPGNNGGDGFVIARLLHLQGWQVHTWVTHARERYQGDAAVNYDLLRALDIPIHLWQAESLAEMQGEGPLEQTILVDALLGTGVSQALRPPIADLILQCQAHPGPVIAVDLPSGLSADHGQLISPVLRADHTFTFQVPKICHAVYPAAGKCGQVHVLDIGLWPQVMQALNIQRYWMPQGHPPFTLTARDQEAHKGSMGHVLIIGGSQRYAGAVALTAYAALRSGAGLVSVMAPAACRSLLQNLAPEAIFVPTASPQAPTLSKADLPLARLALKGKHALVIGPGMTTEPEAEAFLLELLSGSLPPSLLDADALNILAQHPDHLKALPESSVLTPHPGEMSRLTGMATAEAERLSWAEKLAHEAGVHVVLKGAGTIIASPAGVSYVNGTGNPGMATAGSGDVLSGIIGALLGKGLDSLQAAASGVYFHGLAGDQAVLSKGPSGLLARDLIEHLRLD
ncbi:MAG: NAD(P)H-hydrate dehydratase [Bacteroidota bacterium]